MAKIGTSAYTLTLPPSLAIHNTFHISLLEPYQDNQFPSHDKEPTCPIQTEGEDEAAQTMRPKKGKKKSKKRASSKAGSRRGSVEKTEGDDPLN